jgi:hypothetical protein
VENSPILSTRTRSPVLFAEQAIAPNSMRFLHSHVMHFGLRIAADLGVHPGLDQAELLGRDGLEVGEVEAQAIRCHQRALLLHVGAQHFAQGGVQQVGGGVVEDRGGTRSPSTARTARRRA